MDSSEYTLPGIMNYLQSEFTQIEKMKIANNLELSEMKFKIAKLEGLKNALNITNNKLVDDLNGLKKDNTKLLSVIYQLKQENSQLKRSLASFNKDSNSEAESQADSKPAEEEEDSKIDKELRALISGLASTKSQALLIKDIKELSLKTTLEDGSDAVSSLDLTPLVTSRKFLQDCMKEMFYLIKNGNGNIVNNINDFNFDNNLDNEQLKDPNGNQNTGNFNIFDKYNYSLAEEQHEMQLENERIIEEQQKRQQLLQEQQQQQHKHQQRQQRQQQRRQQHPQQHQDLMQTLQEDPDDGKGFSLSDDASINSSGNESNSATSNFFESPTRDQFYSMNKNKNGSTGNEADTHSQFTLLLRSPDLLHYSKLNSNSTSENKIEETNEDSKQMPRIKEAPQIEPQQSRLAAPVAPEKGQLRGNNRVNNDNDDVYFDVDTQSDAETIVETDNDDFVEENGVNAHSRNSGSNVESLLESPRKRDIKLDIIEEHDVIDEEENKKHVLEIGDDQESDTKKIEPKIKLFNPNVPGIIEEFAFNESTNEALIYSFGTLKVTAIKNYKLNVDEAQKKGLQFSGNIQSKWLNNNHFVVFDNHDSHILKVYNKKTLAEVRQINVINDLKEQNQKEKENNQKKSKNSSIGDDEDSDEDENFMRLSDSTIIGIDVSRKAQKLLVSCTKFFYIYDIASASEIKLIKSSPVLAEEGASRLSIKQGAFINEHEILFLTIDGMLKKFTLPNKDKSLDGEKEAHHGEIIASFLPNQNLVKFIIIDNAKRGPSSASQILLIFSDLSKKLIAYQLLDTTNGQVLQDRSLVVKHSNYNAKLFNDIGNETNTNDIKVYAYFEKDQLYVLEKVPHAKELINVIDFYQRKLVSQISYFDTDDIVSDEDEEEAYIQNKNHIILTWHKKNILVVTGIDSTVRLFDL